MIPIKILNKNYYKIIKWRHNKYSEVAYGI